MRAGEDALHRARTPATRRGASVAPVRAEAAGRAAPARGSGEIAVLLLADMARSARAWGSGRFVFGRRAARAQPGVVFAKVLGSGFEGGFGLRPSGSRQGLFCVLEGEADAQRFLAGPLVASYRSHADEWLSVTLRAFSCRGSWSGMTLPVAATQPAHGPIAALTRASIRLGSAVAFWRMAPAAERALQAADGCRLAVGLGEAPLLRQATFSIWDSVDAMDEYARRGAHAEAIRAAYTRGFFSESMFARFVPIEVRGTWKGRRYG